STSRSYGIETCLRFVQCRMFLSANRCPLRRNMLWASYQRASTSSPWNGVEAHDRKRKRLRAWHDRGDLEIFLGCMKTTADRTHGADGRRADARGKARIGAAAGEHTLDRVSQRARTGRVMLAVGEIVAGMRGLAPHLTLTSRRHIQHRGRVGNLCSPATPGAM